MSFNVGNKKAVKSLQSVIDTGHSYIFGDKASVEAAYRAISLDYRELTEDGPGLYGCKSFRFPA